MEEKESQLDTQQHYRASARSSVSLPYKERIRLYNHTLDIGDIDAIRAFAFQGIPDAGGLRAKFWRILLYCMPPKMEEWEEALERNRQSYESWKSELILDPQKLSKEAEEEDHPLSVDNNSKWNKFFKDTELGVEIEKDARRTFPHLHFFNSNPKQGSTEHFEAIKRILFIYAKLNPGISYVQGMNEVLGPIYYVLAKDSDLLFAGYAEHDAFFCFTNLMSEIRDNFCKTLDKSESGIGGNMTKLNQLLKKKDKELWKRLEQQNMDPQFYSFRWLTLLLTQEFELPDVLRMWDSFFADPDRFEFLIYFCAAMILCIREELLEGSFADNLKMLQNYPARIGVNVLLTKAIELHESDKGSLHVLYAARAQQRHPTTHSSVETAQGIVNGFASASYSLFAGLSKYVDMNKATIKK